MCDLHKSKDKCAAMMLLMMLMGSVGITQELSRMLTLEIENLGLGFRYFTSPYKSLKLLFTVK